MSEKREPTEFITPEARKFLALSGSFMILEMNAPDFPES